MSELKVGIVGCAGRMGRMLLAAVSANADCALAGGCEAPGGAALGRDLGSLIGLDPLGLVVGDDPRALFEASELVIDAIVPPAALRDEIAARLRAARGRRDTPPDKRHSVTPS